MTGMQAVVAHPVFGVAVTVMAYAAALKLQSRWKWLHPLFVCAGGLVCFLLLTDIPYESYKVGGDLIAIFLGPATVALGVPLYKQAPYIKKFFGAIMAGVTAGAVSGIVSAGLFMWLLGGSQELMVTMMPKSVTSPIAIEIARQAGGIPELGAVFAVLAGLLGSIVGPALLRAIGISSDVAIGVAIGTSSHGIGTARVLRESELQGSVSGVAMALTGIITSLLFIPLYSWLS